jgi:hypothetical protein
LNAGTVSGVRLVSISNGGTADGTGTGGDTAGGVAHEITAALAATPRGRRNFIVARDGRDTPRTFGWAGYLK